MITLLEVNLMNTPLLLKRSKTAVIIELEFIAERHHDPKIQTLMREVLHYWKQDMEELVELADEIKVIQERDSNE